ncbi:hypothetical protein AAMO2058_000559800 [Amorphochlora amoebiformis]
MEIHEEIPRKERAYIPNESEDGEFGHSVFDDIRAIHGVSSADDDSQPNSRSFAAKKNGEGRRLQGGTIDEEGEGGRGVTMSREDLIKMGREKLEAWKSKAVSGVDMANRILAARGSSIQMERKMLQEMEAKMTDMRREISRLIREKADLQGEVRNLHSVTNNFQEGMRTQEARVTELKQIQARILAEKAQAEKERDQARSEAASLREMLTEKNRKADQVTVVKAGACPRVDLTEILKTALKHTSLATDASAQTSANLDQISQLFTQISANLQAMSRSSLDLQAPVNLPPPPSGGAGGVVMGGLNEGKVSQLQGNLRSILSKTGAFKDLLQDTLKLSETVQKNTATANDCVSAEHVHSVLRKSIDQRDLGVRREEADIQRLIIETQTLLLQKSNQLNKQIKANAFLRRERSVLSNKLVICEEESKMLIDSLKETVQNLLAEPRPAPHNAIHSNSTNGLKTNRANTILQTAAIPASKGNYTLVDIKRSRSSNRRRKHRGFGVKTCYGSRAIHRVHLWESVWIGPLNCRMSPSKKAAILEPTVEHGTILVAEKRCGRWIKHAFGWTLTAEGENVFMARLPLCETHLGISYIVRKPLPNGLSSLILTWCKGYGIMASMPAGQIIKSILDKEKAKITKQLIEAKGSLKKEGIDNVTVKERVKILDSKLEHLMSQNSLLTIHQLIENLELDKEGGDTLPQVSPEQIEVSEPVDKSIPETRDVMVSDDSQGGLSNMFEFLLSVVGLDDSDEDQ